MNCKNKKFNIIAICLFAVLVLLIVAAVTPIIISDIEKTEANKNYGENYYHMEGIWTADNFISPLGNEYLKMIFSVNSDGSTDEIFFLKDGRKFTWKGKLVYNGGNSFTSHYNGFSFRIGFNGNTAKIINPDLGIYNLILERVGDGKDIAGVWKNNEPYDFPSGYKYIEFTAEEDGTGNMKIRNSDSNSIVIPVEWASIGLMSYAVAVSQPSEITFVNDTKLIDECGNVYIKNSISLL